MKEKFMRFMQGRNGVDQFARFTMGVALAAIVLTLFTGTRSGIGAFLDLFGMAAIVYTYFRIFSKNISKRYQENQKYLQMTDKLRARFQKEKRMMSQRKDYHIYLAAVRKSVFPEADLRKWRLNVLSVIPNL